MAITIGQFLGIRKSNPDTPDNPYDPSKESFLELSLPEVPFSPAGPAQIPGPQPVALSTPAALPPPPDVTLSSPAALPAEPAPPLSIPAVLPPPPAVALSTPAVLPPPPPVNLSAGLLPPPPPPVTLSVPATLPAPPAVTLSTPSALPPPPPVTLAAALLPPPPPDVTLSKPATLPPAPAVTLGSPSVLPPPQAVVNQTSKPPLDVTTPAAQPNSGYAVLGDTYSLLGGGDQGSHAADPFLFERQTERMLRLPPGKVALHSMIQVGMFAQNVYGNIWNPALLDPAPVIQNFLTPALDLPSDGKTEYLQVQIGDLVDQALKNSQLPSVAPDPTSRITPGINKAGVQVTLSRLKTGIAAAFDATKNVLANGLSLGAGGHVTDPLRATTFDNGIIPMRLKGDNGLGFRTFRAGQGDTTNDDDVYLPLSFTDLRPVGDAFRTVYFRPLDLRIGESYAPEWNKSQFYGRVDAVATYMSTARTTSISFKLVAFGPEDVRTIYQKLHWLTSMVYPEYDNNLSYKSGPVVRMRVGDVFNSFGPEGSRGVPGIIESLDFDYDDALWELKKDFKLPRNIGVTLSFTVLHDLPVGRGVEGKFGGLGKIGTDGSYTSTSIDPATGNQIVPVDSNTIRSFGDGHELEYDTFKEVDKDKS